MKKFEYVYFNIYQFYSRQGYSPSSYVVRLKCLYLLSISAGGWLLFLQSLFLRFVRNGWFSSPLSAMMNALAIYCTIAFLFHRIYIVEERDQEIFDKYSRAWQQNPHQKRDLVITSFVAAMPYLLMLCIKLYLHRS